MHNRSSRKPSVTTLFPVGVSPDVAKLGKLNPLSVGGIIIMILVLIFGGTQLVVWLRRRRYNLYADLTSGPSDHTQEELNGAAQSQSTSSGSV